MDAEQSAVPIGRPIDNIQTYILDIHGQPAPVNVAGELFLGGVGLARGYWNRPALTAQKFVPNRYSMQEGQRLYRTGDLSHQRPDGVIEFIGRVDFQVKIRGFRVELGEIEAVLSQHAAVREAVVVLSEEIPGDKRLVAYLVPFEPSPTIGELRRFLFDRLPDYMVPTSFVLLDALPLTPNGKVDRRTLPTPQLDRAHLETEYVAPRTPMEEKLAHIWADVLHVDVGIYDHFFELGGHSLLATQVVSRIRDAFQVEISLQQLFDYPILADLMALITEAQTTTVTQEAEMMPSIKKDSEDNEQLLAKLDQLSEQEVDVLLNKMLNKTEIE
jgi:acyl carrier protein